MKATPHERNTDVPRTDLYHAAAKSHGDGIRLRFETGEHGGDYPDNMPQDAIHTRGRQLTVGCAFRPDGRDRSYQHIRPGGR